LFGLLHSPTGGQEREVEDVQEPAAKAEGKRAREIRARVRVEICILDGVETFREHRFERDSVRTRRNKGRKDEGKVL
jgi:hypothetical protein